MKEIENRMQKQQQNLIQKKSDLAVAKRLELIKTANVRVCRRVYEAINEQLVEINSNPVTANADVLME